jgi:structural maintenance of chromosome 4
VCFVFAPLLASIAYDKSKRWRVVTLDGQLIDSTGTMSGGGNVKQRGAMRLGSAPAAGGRGASAAASAASADDDGTF